MIDLEWLRRLVELVDESDIDSLEVSRLATRIRISKSPPGGEGAPSAPSAPPAPAVREGPRAVPVGPPEAGGEKAPPGEEEAEETGLHEIKSPMVGTFYRAPAPDAPPYVERGDRVARGDTLCILEAMKLMNELESEVAGVVREIAVENADPVEYGQVLFRIEPDGG